MTCGIYKIENKLNGKVYIGQSINIEERWKKHRTISNNINHECKNYPLYRSIYKNGLDNFDFSIIEECLEDKLNEREIYWIKYYNSYIPNGYNQTLGGNKNGHSSKLSYEQVLSIRDDLKNTEETELFLAKKYKVSKDTISSVNTGRFWYDENIKYPIRLPYKTCKNCGNKILSENISGYCFKCYTEIERRKNWPSKEKLKELIRTISFAQIGKQFGVRDDAVRHWCDIYKLPRCKSDINKMSDEEWEKL